MEENNIKKIPKIIANSFFIEKPLKGDSMKL